MFFDLAIRTRESQVPRSMPTQELMGVSCQCCVTVEGFVLPTFGLSHLSETKSDDWPVIGPQILLWVVAYISEHYITPDARHQRLLNMCVLKIAVCTRN